MAALVNKAATELLELKALNNCYTDLNKIMMRN
jgi:hypothetical protein